MRCAWSDRAFAGDFRSHILANTIRGWPATPAQLRQSILDRLPLCRIEDNLDRLLQLADSDSTIAIEVQPAVSLVSVCVHASPINQRRIVARRRPERRRHKDRLINAASRVQVVTAGGTEESFNERKLLFCAEGSELFRRAVPFQPRERRREELYQANGVAAAVPRVRPQPAFAHHHTQQVARLAIESKAQTSDRAEERIGQAGLRAARCPRNARIYPCIFLLRKPVSAWPHLVGIALAWRGLSSRTHYHTEKQQHRSRYRCQGNLRRRQVFHCVLFSTEHSGEPAIGFRLFGQIRRIRRIQPITRSSFPSNHSSQQCGRFNPYCTLACITRDNCLTRVFSVNDSQTASVELPGLCEGKTGEAERSQGRRGDTGPWAQTYGAPPVMRDVAARLRVEIANWIRRNSPELFTCFSPGGRRSVAAKPS